MARRLGTLSCLTFLLVALGSIQRSAAGEIIPRNAKDTLTPVEMNHGDRLHFTLASGRRVRLLLEGTEAAIVERVQPGGIVYQFSCRLRIDGQPVTLRRFVCAQQCFYEPFVVAGLRIWPDTVKSVFDLVPIRYPREGNLQCRPRKDARFAVQDASLRICPQETHPWLDEEQDRIDVGRCYNGDDCYLGPYLGQACHVGMDVNHPRGSRLLAPIDFDTQAYFNSLELGDNNNRWRGIRRWANGDVWALQTHHLIRLLVPQNSALTAGSAYATTAGVHVGSHDHTHFEFKVGHKHPAMALPAATDPKSIASPVDFQDESEAARLRCEVLHLDPWIVFWQIFQDRRRRRGNIAAVLNPPPSIRTGQTLAYSAEGSRAGAGDRQLDYLWTFGDGGFATGRDPVYTYARQGVYPVTLVVDDGLERSTVTHHVIVSGPPVTTPVLALAGPDEPSFRPRPAPMADVYGGPIQRLPHALRFVARASRRIPAGQTIVLQNLGGGSLPRATVRTAPAPDGSGWLSVQTGSDPQVLCVVADATGMDPGCYRARVLVDCPGAANSPQPLLVQLEVRGEPARNGCTIDDGDDGFYATPYFWVGHRFSRCPADRRGHRGFYLTNGGQPAEGEFARFAPDLRAGTYEVTFSEATPFGPETEFDVRVRHRGQDTTVRIRPHRSRRIGVFDFDEGTDGYVQIEAGGSQCLVIADAVVFRPHSSVTGGHFRTSTTPPSEP